MDQIHTITVVFGVVVIGVIIIVIWRIKGSCLHKTPFTLCVTLLGSLYKLSTYMPAC